MLRGVCAVTLLAGMLSCADILGIVPGERRQPAAGGDGGDGGSGASAPAGGGGSGGSAVPAFTLRRAHRWGSETDEHVAAVTIDDADHVVIAGNYNGPWEIPPAALSHGGDQDLFAAKIDGRGLALWAYGFGAQGSQVAMGLAQRNEGSGAHLTYVTGQFNGEIHFPMGQDKDMVAAPDDYDGFVTRIGDNPDTHGQNQAFRFIGPGVPWPGPIAVVQGAAKQNLLITGHTNADLGIAGTTLFAQGMQRGFLARLFGGGDPDWAFAFGDQGTQHPRGIAADDGNNVTVVGSFTGALTLLDPPSNAAGGDDAFVLRVVMDVDQGHVQWVQTIGESGSEIAQAVAATPSGGVVVAGTFSSDVMVAGTVLAIDDGDPDVFLVAYDSDGTALWARRIEATNLTPRALIYHAGRLYLGADLDQGRARFSFGELQSAGTDIVLAVFDGEGAALAAQRFGDAAPEEAERQTLAGMVFDSAGNLIVAGNLEGSIDLSGTTLTSAGGKDVFIAELAP